MSESASHSRAPSASSIIASASDKQPTPGTPPPTTNGVNGHRSASEDGDHEDDSVESLKRELEKTRQEKEALASQYNSLLGKLTDMRTRLGTKLKQDAEELDRREQEIQALTAQNEDLSVTVETLKEELIASHADNERTSKELDLLRSSASQENAQEALLREQELREVQMDLERCRMERDEWERAALHEKAISEDAKSTVESLQRELSLEREARQRETSALESEREKTANLQSVLQDFQTAKDHELRQAVKDYESQLLQVTQSLAEYKHRANTAELQLEESTSNSTQTKELEKELKEKNLLIGKLRHEAVIINEHLVEALRRLRKSSSETNVDRRLVTNVILSFLNTPRADSKRFEMLNLLASILSWTDQEREKAGLQRSASAIGGVASPSGGFWGRSSSGGMSPTQNAEFDRSDETESFSRLWVEFLLTEANSTDSNPPPPRNNGSVPNSPAVKPSRRLTSLGSAGMSSPNLANFPATHGIPSRKGKEREVLPES